MHGRGPFSLVIIYYLMYAWQRCIQSCYYLLFDVCMVDCWSLGIKVEMSKVLIIHGICAFSLVIIYYLMYAWQRCIQSCYYLICDVCMVEVHLALLLFIMSCMHGICPFSLVIIYYVMYALQRPIQPCYYLLCDVWHGRVEVNLVLLLFIIDFLLLVIGY